MLNNWSGAISPKMEKIRELNQKHTHFPWSEAHEEEFQDIKEHLVKTTRLATWDKNLPPKLNMDAAKTGGFGFCLNQSEGEREHIVYCSRMGLTDTQKRWSMTKLEMDGIVFALESAYNYTYGADEIVVLTDHASLVGLSKKCLNEIANSRLTSLFDKVSHYNFEIKAIKGEDNLTADVLSRLAHKMAEIPDINNYTPVQTVKVKSFQTRNGKLRIAHDLVEMADRAKANKTNKNSYGG